MSESTETVHGTIVDGVIAVINGTRCSRGYCEEYGCDFPNCATFSDETFETLEKAKAKYPSFELV